MSKQDGAIAICILMLLGLISAGGLYGCPKYNVWYRGMVGEAKLRQAEQEKRIMIETAKAEVEAAELRAKAIEAVGKAARDFPEYRHQEFIAAFGESLQNGMVDQIIYVPTEANVPIVETGRAR